MGMKGETIAAIATPPGTGAIGIIRLSGPESLRITENIFRSSGKDKSRPKPRKMSLGWIKGSTGVLDQVTVCFYPSPRSYTGEDMLEIFAHGGAAVLAGILETVIEAGARPAEPGEFTRRAVLAGKMNLSQAEAVSWLIEATSLKEVEFAARQLRNGLGDKLDHARREVIRLRAAVEVTLDFEEYEEAPLPYPELSQGLKKIDSLLQKVLDEVESGERVRRGLRLVLAGKPNTGKSSLLNQLLNYDRAIVSPLPGTTRDMVEDDLIIAGIAVRIVDTAGIRRLAKGIEAEGVRRARDELKAADLVLIVLDGSGCFDPDDHEVCRLARGGKVLVILNKEDLDGNLGLEELKQYFSPDAVISVSALEGGGIAELRRRLEETILSLAATPGSALMVSYRRNAMLKSAAITVGKAIKLVSRGEAGEVISMELGELEDALSSLLGEDNSEELLDEIFSEFCVGK